MEKKDAHGIYEGYFEEVYQLAAHADIDILAHLDLMKRYAIDSIGNYDFADFKSLIEAILKKAIDRGIGIEINTSGIANKRVNEPFPSKEVLRLYKQLGGEIITIGSDSHRAATVGAHLDDALSLLKEVGFEYVYTFKSRNAEAVKIEV